MQKNHFKSFMGLVLMSLFLIPFAPNNIYAQRDNRKHKNKKEKVETPVRHYNKQPRRGAHLTKLPNKSTVVRYRTSNYHYRDGIFYRPVNNSYVVTKPPLGIRVSVLPPKAYRVNLSGRMYFYYYGIYYVSSQVGGYEVVEAPLGARIDALPDGYEIFELDSKVYYRLDDNYYKAVVEPNGNVVYEVVRV